MGERLQGNVALVTGSTSGIGRATAMLFAQEGAKVVVTGRRRELGEQVIGEIKSAGGEASYLQADLDQSQAARDLVRFTVDTYGRIDILVNNAMSRAVPWSSSEGVSLVDLKEKDWDAMLAVGLKAPYITCQEAIPHMIRQGKGSIINISSVRGLFAGRNGLAYDVAKHGLLGLSRQVTVDYGRYGIRANTICPGWITSDQMHQRIKEDPNYDRTRVTLQPVGRPGRYIDIAYVALFLASDESSFMAGATLVVDGGLTVQTGHTIHDIIQEVMRETANKQ